MRHRNSRTRLNRTSSHRIALLRNLAKSFIDNGKLVTTVEKAKELKKVIEPLITLSKEDSLNNRRRVQELLGIHYNKLTPKEARRAKNGDTSSYNVDRVVVGKLFTDFGPKYKERPGGYTRIVRSHYRLGDTAEMCIIEGV